MHRGLVRRVFSLSMFAWLVACVSISSAAEFRAASSKADITPTGSVDLWGYSDRSGPATGPHDPLYAKILVLDDEHFGWLSSRSTSVARSAWNR